MESINVENDSLSNEEDNIIEKANEKTSLKQLKQNDTSNYIQKRRKKINNKNNFIKNASLIIFFSVLFFLFIIIFWQVLGNNEKNDYNPINKRIINNNNTFESININKSENYSKQKIKEIDDTFSIIEDVKNLDVKPIGDFINSMNEEILNTTKKKIGIAFPYSTLSANGIGRFITVTAKYLQRTGKYNIYFITKKPYFREFSYDKEIKRFIAYNNYTLMRNISKYEKIDIVVLQNVLSPSVVKFHHNLGQKVICMYH